LQRRDGVEGDGRREEGGEKIGREDRDEKIGTRRSGEKIGARRWRREDRGEKMAARKEGDGGVGIQKTGVSQSGTPEIRYISTN
jgi:hypothetical protein